MGRQLNGRAPRARESRGLGRGGDCYLRELVRELRMFPFAERRVALERAVLLITPQCQRDGCSQVASVCRRIGRGAWEPGNLVSLCSGCAGCRKWRNELGVREELLDCAVAVAVRVGREAVAVLRGGLPEHLVIAPVEERFVVAVIRHAPAV